MTAVIVRRLVKAPTGHPRANPHGYILEHRLIAERALGHLLPRTAQVHHVNGNARDNRSCNLVICENNAYHWLLERRTRALRETGNANSVKCRYCGKWGLTGELYVLPRPNDRWAYHRECSKRAAKNRRERLRVVT